MPARNELASSEEPRRRRRDYDRDGERERDRDSHSNTSGSAKEKKRVSRKEGGGGESRSGTASGGKRTVKRRTASEERERASRKERERASTPKIPATMSERGGRSLGVPEMDRRAKGAASLEDVRPRNSYPSFSKAHSREAVGSREDVGAARVCTPESTDLSAPPSEKSKRHSTPAAAARAPPSPPLTAEEPEVKGRNSGDSMRRTADAVREEERLQGRRSADLGGASRSRGNSIRNAGSGASLRKEEAQQFGESDISSMPGTFPEESERKSTPGSGYRRTVSTGSQQNSTVTQNTENTTDSDATSIAPERKGKRPPRIVPVHEASPPSASDSQPKTPTPQDPFFPPSAKATPVIDVGPQQHHFRDDTPQTARYFGSGEGPMSQAMGHPPPPPPPPMTTPGEAPRVDYLLKNGGLPYLIKKKLVDTGPVQQYSMYQSPALVQAGPIEEYQKIFGGINQRLDDYYSVLRKNGSLAVATGYKSVARRLLDKLSQVFARDISSQRCDCVVCRTLPQPYLSDEEDSGISWGEILEFVSGRRELPQWPPFTIQPDDSGLGITGATAAPMQKLDIDVPEEYRDHYIRQNKKTKVAVQNWLAMQPEYPSSPPEEADEDTLMFAMMTKLSTQQRNLFIALMHGHVTVSDSRAPTPAERPTTSSGAIKHTRKALQRLYRLDRPPRDCESAMYLLTNPHLHGMLATLAEVQEQEWDILTSGRFDGFLWSGAEAPFPPSASGFNSPAISRGPSRGPTSTPFSRNTTPFSGMSGIAPSRGNTPFRNNISGSSSRGGTKDPTTAIPGAPSQTPSMFPSRGPTPGPQGLGVSAPGPVQLDEDTEIAVLAEVERAIFMDMERLEDAFELLHGRAEQVRQLLRERSAGLSMQAQMRRGSGAEDIGVRMGTPASGFTNFEEGESEDDGLADMMSLAPDDSASNVSFNRRHRKRHERRTPAPVEEVDEDGVQEVGNGYEGGKKGGRRR